jgi:hypothetical protein
MPDAPRDLHTTPCQRKEKRYKTNIDQRLLCRTSVDEPGQDLIWEGTTVDLSTSGIRLLTDGEFRVGEKIWTELITTRSHGVYRGIVRRIEPWVGGLWILGCSLRDYIPNETLQDLANERIINRRSDGRFSISQRAKISVPLRVDELDVKLQEYSCSGMKMLSFDPIPDHERLRLRFHAGGRELIMEAKCVWSRKVDQGWINGVAFTNADAPTIVAENLGYQEAVELEPAETSTGVRDKAKRFLTFATIKSIAGIAFPTNR